MVTFSVNRTGRSWAGQSYNRTTGHWRDGGAELSVDILDDDLGSTLDKLNREELIAVAGELDYGDRSDRQELLDDVADELDNRIKALASQVEDWNGEDVRDLARLLNSIDYAAEQAASVFYSSYSLRSWFEGGNWYDVTSLPWCGEQECDYSRSDVYASDRSNNWLVLVAGTTDDGWSVEDESEHRAESAS